jgi:DNA-binding MarR family transcriptional regulator
MQLSASILGTDFKNMNSGLTIEIPGGIAELPDLSLAEAVALSHILEHPGCTNRTLARIVRQTERGVETMLLRLRERGLIRLEGSGRGRQIFLTFDVERKKCGESSTSQLHIKCDDPKKFTSAQKNLTGLDFAISRLNLVESCLDAGKFEAARSHMEIIRQAVHGDATLPDSDKEKLLALIKVEEDRCFAFALGAKVAEGLSSTDQMRLACTLSTAPAEKLSVLRERAEARALQASAQTPLLAEVIEKELLI